MASRSSASGSSDMLPPAPGDRPRPEYGGSASRRGKRADSVENGDFQADEQQAQQAVDEGDDERQQPAPVGHPSDHQPPEEQLGDADRKRQDDRAVEAHAN